MPRLGDSAVAKLRRFNRHRRLRRLLLWGGIPIGALGALALWTSITSSTGLCASCHTMDVGVETAAGSIHADLECVDCHGGAGASGAVRYIPTLIREAVQEGTGWHVAGGVLRAKPCTACHEPSRTAGSAQSAAGGEIQPHPDPESDCASCHGDTAHPGRPEPPQKGHPDFYQQTHGRDASTGSRDKCARCHEANFCRSCHVEDPAEHPEDWMATHGETKLAEGRSCTMCHSSITFCKSCHGTEIPHPSDWLERHATASEAVNQSLCATCHEREACARCHDSHAAHRRPDGGAGP